MCPPSKNYFSVLVNIISSILSNKLPFVIIYDISCYLYILLFLFISAKKLLTHSPHNFFCTMPLLLTLTPGTKSTAQKRDAIKAICCTCTRTKFVGYQHHKAGFRSASLYSSRRLSHSAGVSFTSSINLISNCRVSAIAFVTYGVTSDATPEAWLTDGT